MKSNCRKFVDRLYTNTKPAPKFGTGFDDGAATPPSIGGVEPFADYFRNNIFFRVLKVCPDVPLASKR